MKTLLPCLIISASMAISTSVLADKKKAKDAVEYRQAAFQMIKQHFGPLGAMVKGKIPFDADTAKNHADAVATLSHFPINGFKEKSLGNDSTALPKIWDDFVRFETKMTDFQEAASNLSNNTSSPDTLKAAFRETAKTCKGCHDNYRKKKS